MRSIATMLLLFLIKTTGAQILHIPDQAFKNSLLLANTNNPIAKDQAGDYMNIDANNDDEIQISEALAVYWLDVSYNVVAANIDSLDGIESFTNLRYLAFRQNFVTSFDATPLTALETLDCYGNRLTDLRVTNHPSLKYLHCHFNQLTDLDVTGTSLVYLIGVFNDLQTFDASAQDELLHLQLNNNPGLSSINLSGSGNIQYLNFATTAIDTIDLSRLTDLNTLYFGENLVKLDVSNSPNLDTLYCNPINTAGSLQELYMKNNSTERRVYLGNQPNLRFICCDAAELQSIHNLVSLSGYANCTVTTICPYPGALNRTIVTGTIDLNNNGCDAADIKAGALRVNISDGVSTGSAFTNADGRLVQFSNTGTFTYTPQPENLPYYSAVPPSAIVTFLTNNSNVENISFCLVPNGAFNDLEIMLLPLNIPRPGFHSRYLLLYKNKGTTTLSGSVTFNFDDNRTDLVSASNTSFSQVPGRLTWDYTDLAPFEQDSIFITLSINSPADNPPVTSGDILTTTARILPQTGDETPGDNGAKLDEVVVNSFDPNDKTCLAGPAIPTAAIGEYVHYMIRFENTGSAEAINVLIIDTLDVSTLDISSIQPLAASHIFEMKIKEGNIVSFGFDSINLPHTQPSSNGFVAFKIKTKPTLAEFDTVKNRAAIYFDYNLPIVTNVATTIIKDHIDPPTGFRNILLYPNPVKNSLSFFAEAIIDKVEVFDILGRRLMSQENVSTSINVGILPPGIYLIRILTKEGTVFRKIRKL